ncbi:MAG: NAD(P)-binding protein [Legionellaceae bacterium]|nr:NAD(P)-binding protein [Legionellaceae bacterium]
MSKHIAVVGAGISGSLFAHIVRDRFAVTLFEKARGAGGRLSSHRHGSYCFDKGAQDFLIVDKNVLNLLQPALDANVLSLWAPSFMRVKKGLKKWVDTSEYGVFSGQGPINALAKWFLGETSVYYGHEIVRLKRKGKQWTLITQDNKSFGPFDSVIMTQPSHQVIKLVPEFETALSDIVYSRCLMVYLGLEPLNLNLKTPDVIYSEGTFVQWLIQNHLKPGFIGLPSLTIQSKNMIDVEDDPPYIRAVHELIHETELLLETSLKVAYQHHHMWRYAKPLKKSAFNYLWDSNLEVGVIGDGFVSHSSGGIESAILSTIALANQIERLL